MPDEQAEMMIPFLAGMLTTAISKINANEGGLLRIKHVVPEVPDTVHVEFSSGLKLRVKVEEDKP